MCTSWSLSPVDELYGLGTPVGPSVLQVCAEYVAHGRRRIGWAMSFLHVACIMGNFWNVLAELKTMQINMLI